MISQNSPDFFISLIRFCEFVISKNQDDFLISNNRFCDITKYKDFSTDEMITCIKKASAGVFPPTKMADRDAIDHLKCAYALIICGSYHFSKKTEM